MPMALMCGIKLFRKVDVMHKLDRLKLIATLAVALFNSVPAFSQGVGLGVAVREIPEGANTEIKFINNSSNNFFPPPFNIVACAVTSRNGGDNPSTTEPGWTAEALTAALWVQPMGGVGSTLPTWQIYIGMTYSNAFPAEPAEVNAYVTTPGSAYVIAPGDSLNGFFFQGTPDPDQFGFGSDRFLAVKGHSGPIVEGESVTVSGMVEVAVPEPGTPGLCLLAIAILGISGTVVRLNKKKSTNCSNI